MEQVEEEIRKMSSHGYAFDDYQAWGKQGGRPKDTPEVKLEKAKAKAKKKPDRRRASAAQGGSWRQGEGKNVVWTKPYRVIVGEQLIEEMKKMGYEDATGKQQEAFW